jgi:glycerol-3-phosphate cytidylyltransferase
MIAEKYDVGIIAGNFDVIHPGYIKMFKECKSYCKQFIVLLHTDPSIERPHKLKPILTKEERTEILTSIKYIDGIAYYTYEKELVDLIERLSPDIRFLGDDYRGKTYTGFELDVPVHYLNRDHGWSTTKFKKLIADTL